MKGITILGSTGSIGESTLNVITQNPEQFRVIALSADKNIQKLFEQCLQHQPKFAVVTEKNSAVQLKKLINEHQLKTEVLHGEEALVTVATLPEIEYVMSAIVGAKGLLPTLAAIKAQKKVLLANKESLVMAGDLFMDEVRKHQTLLLPIDSEHNAIFQCFPRDYIVGNRSEEVRRIILTASGGAFRDLPLSELDKVTPEQACQHPNWNMGRKITVDCATMMNKGLEVIEAHYLFNLESEKIETLLHPQSIVHSFVEYVDSSVLAQLGNPDMRVPIAHALAWPRRIKSGVASLDLLLQNRLDFLPMDFERFPCLKLAYEVLSKKGTAAAILNAANEAAVQAFLENKLAFSNIFTIIAKVLNKLPSRAAGSLEIILEDDLHARRLANELIEKG